MGFRTLTIGRSSDCDVRIRDQTVSRLHAELTVTNAGRYYLTDCGSLRGTRVLQGGDWALHHQGYVDLSAKLQFGTFETRLERLLDGKSLAITADQPRK